MTCDYSTYDNFLETNDRADSVSGAFLSKSVSRNVYYAAPRTHCAYFTRICTISDSVLATNGTTVYEAGDMDGGTNTRRLGCRFIGRKILDLLISLVRHVGFVLLPAGISPDMYARMAQNLYL